MTEILAARQAGNLREKVMHADEGELLDFLDKLEKFKWLASERLINIRREVREGGSTRQEAK